MNITLKENYNEKNIDKLDGIIRNSQFTVIMIGGYRETKYRSLAVWAAIILLIMLIGAIGVNVIPKEYFGIPERFSVISATCFNAVLGIYLYRGFHFLNNNNTYLTKK